MRILREIVGSEWWVVDRRRWWGRWVAGWCGDFNTEGTEFTEVRGVAGNGDDGARVRNRREKQIPHLVRDDNLRGSEGRERGAGETLRGSGQAYGMVAG